MASRQNILIKYTTGDNDPLMSLYPFDGGGKTKKNIHVSQIINHIQYISRWLDNLKIHFPIYNTTCIVDDK